MCMPPDDTRCLGLQLSVSCPCVFHITRAMYFWTSPQSPQTSLALTSMTAIVTNEAFSNKLMAYAPHQG
jgi:hypothetical protein